MTKQEALNRAEKFMEKHYRPERLNRTEGTRERLIEDRANDLMTTGEMWISGHDAIGRQAVCEKA